MTLLHNRHQEATVVHGQAVTNVKNAQRFPTSRDQISPMLARFLSIQARSSSMLIHSVFVSLE
jgi:hypothetical protein